MPGLQRNTSQRLYAVVRQRILDAIEQGVYQVDQQIPTEPDLCELYGVSRITVRKAITDLVKDGVLTRLQGKGTFVQGRKVENALLTVSGFTDFGIAQGKNTREEVIKQELIGVDDYQQRLDVPPESRIFKLVRVMYLEDEPLFIDYSYIPLARYPEFDQRYEPGRSTYQLLQDQYETRVLSDRKVIDVYTATKAEAKWLTCELGEPLFRIGKIAYDQDGRPVHCSELYCRANRISLTIDNTHK
ncbi:GntR family transcriptional regulator [Pseudomonas sp. RIT-PI-S]|uniref:GntR family transcriptional regulator n=1 Tax=Pseudomonas sp. RIT-PI-S TaxID=3035295 RepID=UPI0021DB6C74|nr:GntR family transcriptional regulator [Pseudomonas sp. RIT-PI-S]